MVAIAMWYSPGRYPGWVCSARSASRKASPWPGLTRKNRLNSLVGPTPTPGRGAPVAVDAIPTSYGPGPLSEAAFRLIRLSDELDLPLQQPRPVLPSLGVRLDATVVSSQANVLIRCG